MEHIFNISKYKQDDFLREINPVLEKITQITLLKKHPKFSKMIGNMQGDNNDPKIIERQESRRKRYRVFGFLLIFIGILIIIPGLASPINWQLVFAGIFAILAGYFELILAMAKRDNRAAFQKSTLKLWDNYSNIIPHEIKFSDENITLGNGENINYNNVDNLFITHNYFVLVYDKRIIVLQKGDVKSPNQFVNFFKGKVGQNTDINTL